MNSRDIAVDASDRTQTGASKRAQSDWRVLPLNRLVAIIALLAAGMRIQVFSGFTTLSVITIILLPVTVPAVLAAKPARRLTFVLVASVLSGSLLAWSSSGTINEVNAIYIAIFTLSNFGIYMVVAWATSVLGMERTAVFYCVGAVLSLALDSSTIAVNPWKYGFSLPVAVIVCGFLSNRSKSLAVIGLVSLGVLGALLDSRSFFAVCVTTAGILIYGKWRGAENRKSRIESAAFLTLSVAAVYVMGSRLLIDGVFGTTNQLLTVAQASSSASLLLSARPEWMATIALMQNHPIGYGLGAVPSQGDYLTAVAGLREIGVNAGGDYYTGYMFGGHFKLHSVLADFWVNFGLVGLVCGVVIVSALLAALLREITSPDLSILCVFTSLSALWFMFFGPFLTNLPWVMFALAIAHFRRAHSAGPVGVASRNGKV
ncbi:MULTISPECIES: hypothetical protein [Rhodococcus]|uniref:Uncharacterized protein n=1 Tax=Rhodococcus oxybenzonivorans TaxID=1990687 RepID=A0AAE4V2H7_9NOCA|nr:MULTISPECIES: hypothetical protein [Rhodococcus]MDV7243723.1 hypothetical protein [Rhodococcus oxybenzonivorans]MDV7267197.1 hypothetical protein [Rhodococcus oxybenzonivorans]MDV7275035.1 hypothetical protein [Rhodococcus oxybenzonivorans]MDV7335273.1 hypothetical protein [Rhodococcus oxybenzonivorans]MDV7345984.1 hypothetical protein [Rhodococcus oxybenzonivorans]